MDLVQLNEHLKTGSYYEIKLQKKQFIYLNQTIELNEHSAFVVLCHFPKLYKNMPNYISSDKILIVKILEKQPQLFQYLPIRFQKNQNIKAAAFDSCVNYMKFYPKDLYILQMILRVDVSLYEKLEFRTRPDIIILLMKLDVDLNTLPREIFCDRELMMESIKYNINIIYHIPIDKLRAWSKELISINPYIYFKLIKMIHS